MRLPPAGLRGRRVLLMMMLTLLLPFYWTALFTAGVFVVAFTYLGAAKIGSAVQRDRLDIRVFHGALNVAFRQLLSIT